jgi:hypothetical protein
MNEGVEILLRRMESNPDEFLEDHTSIITRSKWMRLIDQYEKHLDKGDIEALEAGMRKIQQNKFKETVLAELLDPKEARDGVSLLNISHPNAMLSGGQTHAQHMALHQQYAQAQLSTASIKLQQQAQTQALRQLLDAQSLASEPPSNRKKKWSDMFRISSWRF